MHPTHEYTLPSPEMILVRLKHFLMLLGLYHDTAYAASESALEISIELLYQALETRVIPKAVHIGTAPDPKTCTPV